MCAGVCAGVSAGVCVDIPSGNRECADGSVYSKRANALSKAGYALAPCSACCCGRAGDAANSFSRGSKREDSLLKEGYSNVFVDVGVDVDVWIGAGSFIGCGGVTACVCVGECVCVCVCVFVEYRWGGPTAPFSSNMRLISSLLAALKGVTLK